MNNSGYKTVTKGCRVWIPHSQRHWSICENFRIINTFAMWLPKHKL